MATKPVVPTVTPLSPQRAIEKKYGVIPSPWWFDMCGMGIHIDGALATVGTELVFKCADSGIVCGAGFFALPGLLRFSPCYGNDPYETRKSGKITGLMTGEAVRIYAGKNAPGLQYDYHPTAVFTGVWQRVMLTELWPIWVG